MKTAQQLRDEYNEVIVSYNAMIETAREEKRELNDEETAEELRIVGDGSKDNPGIKAQFEASIATAERRETNQKVMAAQMAAATIGSVDPPEQLGGDVQAKFKLPAQARRHAKLQAFSGPDAERDAYTAGQMMLATIGESETARQWCNDHSIDIRAAGLVEKDNSLGGYFVPVEMETGIIRLVEEYGVYRRNVRTTPMGSDKKTKNKRISGVTVYFPGEAETITASDPSYGQIELTAKKMAALTPMSNELSEDEIISLADELSLEFAYALAVKEDQCGFIGDGTSTYGGFTGVQNVLVAAGIQDAVSGNVSFATFDTEDFRKTKKLLSQYPGISPKWYIHPDGWSDSMERLGIAAPGNVTQNFENGMNVTRFLGYPVEFTQALPSADVVSTVQVLFGDLSMSSTMGLRRGITIASDSSVYFTSDQIAVKVTQRIAINNHETSGAMVGLKTAPS